MKFPFVVEPSLTDAQLHRYTHHIDSDESGWHRRWTESIWRRHQDASNARQSGWQSPADRRRRIIHFYDEYGLEGRDFVLRHPYLYLSLTLTEDAIAAYEARIRAGLAHGGWSRQEEGSAEGGGHREIYRRGDLEAVVTRWDVHPEDARRNNAPPAHYRSLDLRLRTIDKPVPEGWAERPWKVFFDVGLREKLPRGNPRIVEPEDLAAFFPAQVELGCGPSIEAGIPHLSTLHRIYGVSHGDYGFVFRAEDDAALEVLFEPERKYAEMTEIYRACLVAKPTSFYRTMVKLYDAGHLVGPVITNNFDCQCADLGLPERSLRKYDWGPYYPEIQHPAEAKAIHDEVEIFRSACQDWRTLPLHTRTLTRAGRSVDGPNGAKWDWLSV